MNSKAQVGNLWGIILLVGALFVLVFVGIIFAMGGSVITLLSDTIVPEFSGLGMVGDFNATQASHLTLDPVVSILNNFTWFGGAIYILGLIAILGVAFVYRVSMQRWLIPVFFIMMVLLIFGSILLSNSYEGFYAGTDDIALRLQSQMVLSFLILYSPAILSIIGFIGGAIMFSGTGSNEQ